MTSNILKPFLILIFVGALIGSCSKKSVEEIPETEISSNFESGSIGEVTKESDHKWVLALKNDNDNPDLPERWRNWWYVRMDHVSQSVPTEIRIKNRGWPYYYTPVYSYDQENWFRFTEEEVTQNEDNELLINKKFEHLRVWIARFYPYTFSHLEIFIEEWNTHPSLKIQTAGKTQENRIIYLLTISDFDVDIENKKRVIMHARTHPAETPPSFLLEGMIDFLLSGSSEAKEILKTHEFSIFPMQNVDGVISGNYRSTPLSENLEVMWYYDTDNPVNLKPEAPQEVSVIHQYAKELMSDGGPPVSLALNLHASNSEPDIRTFFYPHFGTLEQGYSEAEASLWGKQIAFINSLAMHLGSDMIEPTTEEGGSSFASKTYPESWWWVNYQDQVMAMTMEQTYGRAGYAPYWVQPDDMRAMGVHVALGIRDYFNGKSGSNEFIKWANTASEGILKYPHLYPPRAKDELKE